MIQVEYAQCPTLFSSSYNRKTKPDLINIYFFCNKRVKKYFLSVDDQKLENIKLFSKFNF